MSDIKLYQQKMRVHLDGWKAEVDKLKVKASVKEATGKLKE